MDEKWALEKMLDCYGDESCNDKKASAEWNDKRGNRRGFAANIDNETVKSSPSILNKKGVVF